MKGEEGDRHPGDSDHEKAALEQRMLRAARDMQHSVEPLHAVAREE